jgi:PPOX class probable F420-dependent enzyme
MSTAAEPSSAAVQVVNGGDRGGTNHISQVFRALAGARYVSLTTFRRDGTAVATPVCMVMDGARMYVQAGRDSGKVKRIRRSPQVEVAPCRARGQVTGPPVPAVAWVAEGGEADLGARLLRRKYGWQKRPALFLAARRGEATVSVKIVPAGG